MGGGGGKKGGGSVKNPLQIQSLVQFIGLSAVRGYSGLNAPEGADLDMSKFLVTTPLEVEKVGLTNIGHPLYRPFMVRRYGNQVGLPEESQLAYDAVNGNYWSFSQLQEGMRVIAGGKITTMDDYDIDVGDTINFEDTSMGVRRLWLVDGSVEDANGIEHNVIDVLGG